MNSHSIGTSSAQRVVGKANSVRRGRLGVRGVACRVLVMKQAPRTTYRLNSHAMIQSDAELGLVVEYEINTEPTFRYLRLGSTQRRYGFIWRVLFFLDMSGGSGYVVCRQCAGTVGGAL